MADMQTSAQTIEAAEGGGEAAEGGGEAAEGGGEATADGREHAAGSERCPRWMPLLLVALTIASFWSSLSGQFVYDDIWLIQQNPTIQDLARLPEALAAGYWDFVNPETASQIGYWRPLSTVALSVGFQLGNGSPLAFHALSLVLHIGACLALMGFLRRLTRRTDLAFIGALLFALHPVQVESIAWISSVNAPLSGLCALLALSAWLKWHEAGRGALSGQAPWVSAVWLLLAIFAKESAMATLVMLFVLDLYLRKREESRGTHQPGSLRCWWPMAIIVALYFGLRMAVFQSPWAGLDRVTTDLSLSPLEHVGLRLRMLGEYIALSLWPHPLNPFRDPTTHLSASDLSLWVSLATAGLFCVGALMLLRRKDYLSLMFLCLWLGGLAPILSRLSSLGRFLVSDRFLYLPLIGMCALVAAWLCARLSRKVALASGFALALLLGWRTHVQSQIWSSESALFETAVQLNPNNPYVHWGLGRVHLANFQSDNDYDELNAALGSFQSVVELHDRARDGDRSIYAASDDFLQANLGMGWCYLFEAMGTPPHQFELPEKIFETTAVKFPDSEGAFTGLGVSRWKAGNIEGARQAFHTALRLNPRYWEAASNLGQMEFERNRFAEAEAAFGLVQEWRPQELGNLVRLASAKANLGQQTEARELFNQILNLDPCYVQAHIQLGKVATQLGRPADARTHYTDAIQCDRNNARAWMERGLNHLALKNPNDAISDLRRACDLDPGHFLAHYNLGALLVQAGENQLAIQFLERAFEVAPEANKAAIEAEVERLKAL